MKYTGTIDHADACTVKTYCVADGMLTSPTMTYQFDMFINKSAWKVVSYDSQHGGNEARLAIDGNNSTSGTPTGELTSLLAHTPS